MSKKKDKEIAKLALEHAAILRLNDGKFAKEKLKLLAARKKLSSTTLKWQDKLDKLHKELDMASDATYNEKKKRWYAISEQVEKAQAKENEMRNYIEGMEETNLDLVSEVKEAIKLKRAAEKSTAHAKKLAEKRLGKCHAEVNASKEAEDELIKIQKNSKKTEKVMDKYKDEIARSEVNKREMKKESENKEAARRRGGARRWPVWVV